MLLALLLTSVLQPPALLLERKAHLPPSLAAAAVMPVGLGAIIGAAALLTPRIAGQADDIAAAAAAGVQRLREWVRTTDMITEDQVDAVLSAVQRQPADSSGDLVASALTGLRAVGSGLVTFVLTLLLVFMFLKDGRRFLPWTEGIVGHQVGRHVLQVAERAWHTLGD